MSSMKIENAKVYGLEESVRRSGLPMKIELDDSSIDYTDWKRSKHLGSVKTGTGHDNFLKGIIVQFDLFYPEYFSPQLQRYHWIDIISSMSKMHMITKMNISDLCNEYVDEVVIQIMKDAIQAYNIETDKEAKAELYKYIISNCPMGLRKWMAISTNYLQLKTIYQQRRNHKLEEWHYFCDWIEDLPMFKELVLKEK